MSMVPPNILEFRKEVAMGADQAHGLSVADDRLRQVLQESGWTMEQVDLDIKEHCLASRTLSADGSRHFYKFLAPVDMPPVG